MFEKMTLYLDTSGWTNQFETHALVGNDMSDIDVQNIACSS